MGWNVFWNSLSSLIEEEEHNFYKEAFKNKLAIEIETGQSINQKITPYKFQIAVPLTSSALLLLLCMLMTGSPSSSVLALEAASGVVRNDGFATGAAGTTVGSNHFTPASENNIEFR